MSQQSTISDSQPGKHAPLVGCGGIEEGSCDGSLPSIILMFVNISMFRRITIIIIIVIQPLWSVGGTENCFICGRGYTAQKG